MFRICDFIIQTKLLKVFLITLFIKCYKKAPLLYSFHALLNTFNLPLPLFNWNLFQVVFPGGKKRKQDNEWSYLPSFSVILIFFALSSWINMWFMHKKIMKILSFLLHSEIRIVSKSPLYNEYKRSSVST